MGNPADSDYAEFVVGRKQRHTMLYVLNLLKDRRWIALTDVETLSRLMYNV